MTRSNNNGWTAFIAAGACALLMAACVPPTPQPVAATPANPKAQGETLYTAGCAGCHGEKGEKLSPAGGLSKLGYTKFKEGLAKAAMDGVAGIADMRKSEDQISALMAYLAAKNQ